jgi:hypothetical protein
VSIVATGCSNSEATFCSSGAFNYPQVRAGTIKTCEIWLKLKEPLGGLMEQAKEPNENRQDSMTNTP